MSSDAHKCIPFLGIKKSSFSHSVVSTRLQHSRLSLEFAQTHVLSLETTLQAQAPDQSPRAAAARGGGYSKETSRAGLVPLGRRLRVGPTSSPTKAQTLGHSASLSRTLASSVRAEGSSQTSPEHINHTCTQILAGA